MKRFNNILVGVDLSQGDRLVKEYLSLADRYAREIGGAFVVVARGLMGTGKSTLAQALAESLGTELIQTDEIRREIFGTSEKAESYGRGIYDIGRRVQVYSELMNRAEECLADGLAVVLDGAFLTKDLRDHVFELANHYRTPVVFVECCCPQVVAQERIRDRLKSLTSPSEARPELYSEQAREEERDLAGLRVMQMDTTRSLGCQLQKVLGVLSSELCFARRRPSTTASR